MKSPKIIAAALAACSLVLSLTACAGDDTTGSPSATTTDTAKTSFTVAAAVIVQHPSLQMIRDGFADVLAEKGIEVTYIDENANGDGNTVVTIANQFKDNAKIDLILAISTPIAQAIVKVEQDRPILYAGITDPVVAKLVPFIDKASGTNVAGTSDLNPNGKPVELITQVLPDAKKIGVIYTSSEPNSLVQVENYKAEAAPLGVEIVEAAITNSSELAIALATLSDVDAILVPTDNNVVAGISAVIGYGEQNQIPVFTADAESVVLGTVASRGVSYYQMGRDTGEMAYQILVQGVDIATVPCQVTQDTTLFINLEAAAAYGVTIPDAVQAGATVVKTER
ncbi:MAG: ABC transporter substrate-binding protein [Propionibacteriaceae bacterium]|jgi:putative ABC transport system substrate-binding protein|nr:ABC transporter substrate-binding protein [Propionibacteriaceae bacterium]